MRSTHTLLSWILGGFIASLLLGGVLFGVFQLLYPTSPTTIPELRGVALITPEIRSGLPVVLGARTAVYSSQRITQVVGQKVIREQNTRGALSGLYSSHMIGTGKHLYGKEPNIIGALRGVQLAQHLNSNIIINQHMIIDKIQLLAPIASALEVEVLPMLNQSTDRFSTLMEHIRLLEDSRTQLAEGLIEIRQEGLSIRSTIRTLETQKNTSDQAFFANARALIPQESYDAFALSVGYKEELARLEAQLSALRTLEQFYLTVQKKVELKYLTLRANQEPLIKGVTVVEIKDMEPNLIISEREWRSITGITD